MKIKLQGGTNCFVKFSHRRGHKIRVKCTLTFTSDFNLDVNEIVSTSATFNPETYCRKKAIDVVFRKVMKLAISNMVITGKDIEIMFHRWVTRGCTFGLYFDRTNNKEYPIDKMKPGRLKELVIKLSKENEILSNALSESLQKEKAATVRKLQTF